MMVFVPFGKRRAPVSWSADARATFTRIADELENQPDVRVGIQRTGKLTVRPMVFVRRKLVAAGFEDGIAVRLTEEDKGRALQVFPSRELGRRDPRPLRGMIAMPWSAHERWQEFLRSAVSLVGDADDRRRQPASGRDTPGRSAK